MSQMGNCPGRARRTTGGDLTPLADSRKSLLRPVRRRRSSTSFTSPFHSSHPNSQSKFNPKAIPTEPIPTQSAVKPLSDTAFDHPHPRAHPSFQLLPNCARAPIPRCFIAITISNRTSQCYSAAKATSRKDLVRLSITLAISSGPPILTYDMHAHLPNRIDIDSLALSPTVLQLHLSGCGLLYFPITIMTHLSLPSPSTTLSRRWVATCFFSVCIWLVH